MSRIQELLRLKKEEIAARKGRIQPSDLPRDDRRICWHPGKFHVLAEMKRSSLSAGTLRKDLSLAKIARGYERAGVSAISVLTESHFFGGSMEDLALAKQSVKRTPVLQKDFVIDESQIYEARRYGADFVLLIVRFLSKSQVKEFAEIAEELKLNTLLEVHSEKDVAKLPANARFVGANSRDLRTLEMDLSVFDSLSKLLPEAIRIAESGIREVGQLQNIVDSRYHGVLIGETLMRSNDPAAEASRFVDASRSLQKTGDVKTSRTKIKICGITNERDAMTSVASGVDALGFIFAESPRSIDPEVLLKIRHQIPPHVLCVGVFLGQTASEIKATVQRFALDVAQIYDNIKIKNLNVWSARLIRNPQQITPDPTQNILWDLKLDPEQRREAWKTLSSNGLFALAGGLDPQNVIDALALSNPQWVDVARGVEKEPGMKDPAKVRALIRAVRGASR